MMKSKNRGFTLIELLVVIAIIGILSSVVLASLNTARGKGNNAKIKGQLSAARAAAEIYYDNTGSYSSICSAASSDSSGIYTYLQSANYPGSPTITCTQSATAYAISVPLSTTEGSNTYWCIDSAGKSKGETAAQASGVYTCA